MTAGPGVGEPARDNGSGERPVLLSPGGYRNLQRDAAEIFAFAAEANRDPVAYLAGGNLGIAGFMITDLRRFVSMLVEAEVVEDYYGEQQARTLIAGYVRAALEAYDRGGAVR
jgi:hypothetical protein